MSSAENATLNPYTVDAGELIERGISRMAVGGIYPYLAEDFGPSVVFVSPEDGTVYAGEGAIKAADRHATESSPKAFADQVAAGAVYSWLSAYGGIPQHAEDQPPSSVFVANGVASAGDQAYIEAARYRRAQAAAATLAPAATAEAAQVV
jgi:hypothetical protein